MEHKIVFVDNNVDLLKSSQWLLQDKPYRFFAFENPNEALNQIKKIDCAVVMVDQDLLEMSGAELLKMVKQISPNTVRAIMAERTQLKIILEAIQKGYVNQLVLKPLDEEELKQSITMGIKHYKMRLENIPHGRCQSFINLR